MINNDQIPPWLLSKGFQRRFLQVRHGALILFQVVGLSVLVLMCVWLFGDASGYSPEKIGPAAPWWGKLWPIGFVVGWNVLVFYMLRQSAGILRQINERIRKSENGGRPENE